MPVFIELTTDAFEEVLAGQLRGKQGSTTSGAGRRIARRPTRGLEIKEDTFAIIKVVRADGRELPLVDSSSPDGETTSGYANFMLQSVQEARMEKHQIVETFGESYIFFFGEAPRFLDVTVVLLNSHDFNWEAEWWHNYNLYLRGTKSVEMGARTYLFYDDNIVEGYMLQAQAAKTSDQPLSVQLTFRMFVTNHQNISFIGDPNFPIRSSVDLPPDISLTDGNAASALLDKYRSDARDAVVQNAQDSLANSFISGSNDVGGWKRLSDVFRATAPSMGYSPDVWTQIQGLEAGPGTETIGDRLREMAERSGKPLRGLIAQNTDEYVGAAAPRNPYVLESDLTPSALQPVIRGQQEVDDLFRESIQFLSCYGANINSPGHLIKLGLGPKFGSGANDGATWKPIPGVPFGFGTTEVEGFPSKQSLKQFQQDPLGSVFGSSKKSSSSFGRTGTTGAKYSGGSGDPGYGYPSDHSSGPGFGISGFGDFGGLGFGSGQGSGGDPGYKDPSKFTYAGVASNKSAFERFLKPKPDPTSLTASAKFGLGAGTAGLTGSASVPVEGKPSAFAIASVNGSLDPSGNFRASATATAGVSARQNRGFTNPNPFGVVCPEPGGAAGSYSKSYKWP